MTHRLVAFDALNIVRRCWEANPAEESLEKLRDTARSATGTLRRALRHHAPTTHAVAVFDFGGPNWRHQLHDGYRRSRGPMPDLLREGLAGIQATFRRELGVESLAVPGVEADDTLATLCRRWLERLPDAPVIIVSTDKDLVQTLAFGAKQWHPFDDRWLDEAWVEGKFHAPPHLVGDCLALIGDPTDDVPGIHGIGPKTAGPLLVQHGGLEALLAAAGGIRGKVGERLRQGADVARLSRRLVDLRTDVPCGVSWSQLVHGGVA